ncbi:TATA box binding protein (TBP)-associated factor [Capsaspora owczarzaki ATCC 30864]|uniref:Adenylate kinase isoenzyme 6 homolog n=1 Tax=Capsaspora owczarzaki (strain ATCC 30864) TaxID=595528 RepID=A0A0D2VTC8_CAPO3|nr:TATA box binding protein (TBP)-associated factor [Capsaspora owczarzaki ATCC 30864]
MRSQPSILITGTPGVGKTTLCELVSAATGYPHYNVSQMAKDGNMLDGWDEEYQTHLLDELEPLVHPGGAIVDYHGCELFPKRWFDLVVVLCADNTVLYDRLSARGYTGKKLSDNVESEIMQVILQEAHESYDAEIILHLENDTTEQMEQNVQTISEWIAQYKLKHA